MTCPCNLTRTEVLALHQDRTTPLLDNRCQNPYVDESVNDDGSLRICGKLLGAHPTEVICIFYELYIGSFFPGHSLILIF